ncbi:hypothetical protein GGI12_001083 [Dipsacomyces acuminosporus]|nr:hypothetical protein GGI12_001083 [Dipsacomyces acuminosporus]
MAAPVADIKVEALQSMKRKQLQALCKKHGIKANGKNEELIEQLTDYVQHGGVGENGKDRDDGGSDSEQEYESATEAEVQESQGQGPTGPKKAENSLDNNAAANKDDEGAANELAKDKQDSDTEIESSKAEESPGNDDSDNDNDSGNSGKQELDLAEKIAAEMEARAAALTSDQRKEAIDKYNQSHSIPVETPNKSKQAKKAISFDKAHDKLFEHDDSITSHWAAKRAPGAATPRNKRVNGDLDAAMQGSTKRQRTEQQQQQQQPQLFTPQLSARQRRKSTKSKSKTVKAQRTAAASTKVSDGSKTTAFDGRTRAIGPAELSGTRLFADKVAKSAGEPKGTTEFALLTESNSEKPKMQESLVKTSRAETKEAVKPKASEKSAIPKPAVKADAKKSDTKPAEQPALGKTKIPLPRPIAKPKSKIRAQASSKKPNSADSKTASKPAEQRPKEGSKHTSTKIPVHPPANYKSVESKLKSYISAKPVPAPKVKAVAFNAPDAKGPNKQASAKAALSNNKQSTQPSETQSADRKKEKKKARPPLPKSEKKGNDDKVPNYMKSTKATEIRSQNASKPTAPVRGQQQAATKPGSDTHKARYNPYGRPAKAN